MTGKKITACILALMLLLTGCGRFGVSRDKVPPLVLEGFEVRVSFTTVAELEKAGFELGLLYEGTLYRYRESADETFAAATYDDEVQLVRDGQYCGKITVAKYAGEDKPLGDCTVEAVEVAVGSDFADLGLLLDGQEVDVSDIAGAAASPGLAADGEGGYGREVKLAGQVYRVELRPADKAPGVVGRIVVQKVI